MKNLVIILLIASGYILTGCKKAPINEKIEGHWLLKSVTVIEYNETIYPERLYYSIGRKLVQLEEKIENNTSDVFVGRTTYQNNETILVITDLVIKTGNGDQGIHPNKEQLIPYGIINPKETIFEIRKSSGHELILESNWARIVLERF